VFTIAKDGKHPEVKVKGKGLSAVVTVGEQTVRYVDGKITFGQ
jgi:hypothetical protein